MGTYCTTTALDILMVGVTFDAATTSVATKCIDWAEDEINKKITKRYSVTDFLASTPPLITSLCEQLSLGYLYDQLSRGSKESQTRADRLIKRVSDNLDLIASGKVEIVDSSGSLVNRRSGILGVLANTKDYTPTFAEDNELNWATDTDKLDDISSSRD